VFVEGTPEKYQKAREMIEEIIKEHRRSTDCLMHIGDKNPFPGPYFKMPIPNKQVGLIIGKNGDTLRAITNKSRAQIFVPKEIAEAFQEQRIIEISGDHQAIEMAKAEI